MYININDKVKVKLTEHGKHIYKHQFDELNERIKRNGGKPIKLDLPEADADGYTTFQLWCLMEIFGPHMHMGRPIPFDTEIMIPTDGDPHDSGQ